MTRPERGATPPGARLLLASASPRRRELLAAAGLVFDWLDPGGDGPAQDRDPAARVLEHARYKARRGAELRPGRPVLAADTLVYRAGRFYPKPEDRAHARRMLEELAGREHEVWTGVVLRSSAGVELERAERAVVRFRPVPAAELAAYLETGEWRDKAGAYAIQGRAGRFAELVAGSFDTVVGLPVAAVLELLAQAGLAPPA